MFTICSQISMKLCCLPSMHITCMLVKQTQSLGGRNQTVLSYKHAHNAFGLFLRVSMKKLFLITLNISNLERRPILLM